MPNATEELAKALCSTSTSHQRPILSDPHPLPCSYHRTRAAEVVGRLSQGDKVIVILPLESALLISVVDAEQRRLEREQAARAPE